VDHSKVAGARQCGEFDAGPTMKLPKERAIQRLAVVRSAG
jgi:hypothetical protein